MRVEENEVGAYLVHSLYAHPLFHIKHAHKPNKKRI